MSLFRATTIEGFKSSRLNSYTDSEPSVYEIETASRSEQMLKRMKGIVSWLSGPFFSGRYSAAYGPNVPGDLIATLAQDDLPGRQSITRCELTPYAIGIYSHIRDKTTPDPNC